MKHSREAKPNSKEEFKGKRQYRRQVKIFQNTQGHKNLLHQERRRCYHRDIQEHIKEFLEIFNMLYVSIFCVLYVIYVSKTDNATEMLAKN